MLPGEKKQRKNQSQNSEIFVSLGKKVIALTIRARPKTNT